MSPRQRLRQCQDELIARRVRDLKIFIAHTARDKPIDKVLDDTADFLRAYLDGRYIVVDKIGDSHWLRA